MSHLMHSPLSHLMHAKFVIPSPHCYQDKRADDTIKTLKLLEKTKLSTGHHGQTGPIESRRPSPVFWETGNAIYFKFRGTREQKSKTEGNLGE